jgi:hypothetical protein
MASPSTPAPHHSAATRIGLTIGGLTLGGGGAGWLVTLAVAHKPSTTVIAAVAITAALAANTGVLLCKTLPEIIRAISYRETARIRATAEAETMIMRVRVRTELAQAGIEPDKSVMAIEMLRFLALDPDMSPDGRRLNDNVLAKLLVPRPRSIAHKPSTGPERPDDPKKLRKGDSSNVIPIHPDS